MAKLDVLGVLFGDKYHRRTRNGFPAGVQICAVCGKVVNERTCSWVHVADGGASIVTEDEPISEAGDMSFFPVGRDCLKGLPEWQPFAHKAIPDGGA